MLRLPTRRTVAGVMLLAIVAAGCGDDDATTSAASTTGTAQPSGSTSSASEETADVLEVAASEGDLGTFLAATEAAGIMDGLHGTGPFTVFMPTDEAFGAYLEQAGMSQSEVFADPVMLRRVVEHHIVNMEDDADMVMSMDGQSFTSAAGTPLSVSVEGDDVRVGDALVLRYDLQASNGVIHVVDAVLIPPSS